MAKRSERKKRNGSQDAIKSRGAGQAAHANPFEWNQEWLLGAILFLLVFAAYSPVWWAGFVWDDDAYITDSAPLRSLHGLWQIWFVPGATEQYYPLTNTTFWIEYHLWGLAPLGYHLDNVLLHAGNALLLWLIFRKLEVPGAWLGAALFALHPVSVESVAWVTERKNTLSGFFYLCSIFNALGFWKTGAAERRIPTQQWMLYWLALFLYGAALLSKTATSPLPLVIVLLLWWKRPKLGLRDLFPLLPFFVLGFVMGLVTLWVEKHYVRTTGASWDFSLPERCIIIGKALWFYPIKLIWPYPLVFVYPRWVIDVTQPVMYLPFLTAIGASALLWYRRNTKWKPVFVAVAYYLLLIFPACGTFNQYFFVFSFVADHLQYLACIGPLALIAATVNQLLIERINPTKRWVRFAVIIGLPLILGIFSWQRTWVYESHEELWLDTIPKNPECAVAYNNLGDIFAKKGQLDDAFASYAKAVQLYPRSATTFENLATVLLKKGEITEALSWYQQAVSLEPSSAKFHNDLGVALVRTGQMDEAIAQFQKTVQIDPNFAPAYWSLGTACLQKGQLEEASSFFRTALKINPSYAQAHNNLGFTLFREGEIDEAISHYRQALEIEPDYAEAHNNLGVALVQKGEIPEGINQFEIALKLKPDLADAKTNSAKAQRAMEQNSQHRMKSVEAQSGAYRDK